MRLGRAGAVAAWLWAGLVAGGCQCLVPVDDRADGGGDAGVTCDGGTDCRDAGTTDAGTVDAGPSDAGPVDAGTVDAGPSDAGPGDAGSRDGGCERAAQCTAGAQPTINWCVVLPPGAAFSCVANTCLWECPINGAKRTCGIDGGCLDCGDAGTDCPRLGNCGGPTGLLTTVVEPGSQCATWPGTTLPFTSVTIARTASAECRYLAFHDGGTPSLGEFWRLANGDYLAYFPDFGGWCTGRSAFTGAPRGIFNCPACQFVLVGFE